MSNNIKLIKSFENLDALDKDLAIIRLKFGNPKNRFSSPNLISIIRIIVGQQISRNVASILWERIKELEWDNTETIAGLSIQKLHSIGISRKKAEYIINLSKAEMSGVLQIKKLNKKPRDDFFKIMLSYNGIGPWTLNNYRLFSLYDFDAWPGNDLALMEAVKIIKKFSKRPTHEEMNLIAEAWKPYRGAAALLLWHLHSCVVKNKILKTKWP